MYKKLKLDHTTKSYIHKPESILENEMHKILWDFEIRTNPLIVVRKPVLVSINGKKGENIPYSVFCRPSGPHRENQRKWKGRHILRPCQSTKTAMEHEGVNNTIYGWCTWNGLKKLEKGCGRDENSEDEYVHEETSCHIQTPVKDHQWTLVWKNYKDYNNNNDNNINWWDYAQMTWTWLRNGNLRRETENPLINKETTLKGPILWKQKLIIRNRIESVVNLFKIINRGMTMWIK